MTKLKITIITIVSAVVVIAILLAGMAIGSAVKDSTQRKEMNSTYIAESGDAVYDGGVEAQGEDAEDVQKSFVSSENDDQKLVYTGDVTIGTDDVKKSYKEVTEKITEHKAKIESLDESNGSKTIVVRVPKENFFKFYNSLSDITGNITSSNMNAEDMTKSYTDNKRRIDVLETEYNELKKLMSSAKNVKEVLSIRDRMSDLTFEIESLKGENNNIDYDSKYSTLTISIMRVGSTAIEKVPFWLELKEAFLTSIEGIKSLVLGIVTIWWVFALIGGGIWFVMRKIKAKHDKSQSGE